MPSVLRTLQNEWNQLVPQARDRGIPRVRLLNVDAAGIPTVLEKIAYRQAKLEWLRAQLGTTADFNTLTFGVEIEFIMPATMTNYRIAELVRAAGVDCHFEAYNHTTRSSWKVVTDGSLVVRAGRKGFELVSPPMRGEDGFEQLRKVCKVLVENRCEVNKTCGLHVHVGAAEQHVGFFKNLVRLYAHAEGAIDSILSPSRRGSSNAYCQPIRYAEEALDRASTVTEVAWACSQNPQPIGLQRDATRYRKLNLQSFWQHGTVEFRQHQGTIEAQKAENWVRLCMRLCLAAMEGPKVATTLDDLMEAAKLPPTERAFFRARAAHFARRPQ